MQAWHIAVGQRPQCSFWFYTRSFQKEILVALTQLAALPNCQGWLSADSENFAAAIGAYKSAPDVWKIALMQEKQIGDELIEAIEKTADEERVVNFPYHHAGRHIKPISEFFVCPQVLGHIPLETNVHAAKPCQQCLYCLPKMTPQAPDGFSIESEFKPINL